MLKLNTPQKGKIGILLPRSSVFTQANQHLTEGLQLYFTLHCPELTEDNCDLVIEDIANATIKTVRDKAEKLLLSDRVKVLAGVMSFEVALSIVPLLEKTETMLVLLVAGGHSKPDQLQSRFIHTISLQTWQSNYCLGRHAAEHFGSIAFFSSLYDSGFDHNNAFASGFQEKEPMTRPLFMTVSHIQSDKEDFGRVLAQAPEGKYEAVVGSYLQELALSFLQIPRKEPLLLSPLSLPWHLAGFESLPARELTIAGTWPWHAPEIFATFAAQAEQYLSKTADYWHLLGYEGAQLISQLFTLAHLEKADSAAQLLHIQQCNLQTPRGTLLYDSSNNHFGSEMAINHLRIADGNITLLEREVCTMPVSEPPAIHHLRNTEKSAWLQPYGF